VFKQLNTSTSKYKLRTNTNLILIEPCFMSCYICEGIQSFQMLKMTSGKQNISLITKGTLEGAKCTC